jgi:hypothetical protein
MTDPLPSRSVTLAEFRAAPASILGGAIDAGHVVLIGYDPQPEATRGTARPLGVLVGYELWQRLAGTEDDGDVPPSEEPAPKAVPIKDQPGWWCCAVDGCSGVTDEAGGLCDKCEKGCGE